MQAGPRRLAGFGAFSLVWLGQLISVLATNMTHFGLTLWMYERTGSVTALALQHVFFITPFLLISPVAGAMVDRYNRKLTMMVSDLAAGMATVFILAMQALGALEVWHLYAAALVTGTFQAFQWPAYSASISLMVPKAQYGRANGMMSLVEAGPGVISPLLAGALLPLIGLTGIMLLDVATFVLAIAALLIVFVPQPPATTAGKQGRGSLLKEGLYGFRYILARPSLLGLQVGFFFSNLFSGLGLTAWAPMILARTGNNAAALGTVQSVGAVGGIIGGVAMSAWGGFRGRRAYGVLAGWIVFPLLGMVLGGLGRGLPAWVAASFAGAFLVPIVNGSNQAIWQAKVAPDVQGRVFAARRLIAWMTTPLTPLIAGPLADLVLEPGMRAATPLSAAFGGLVGTGPGAGMALMLVFAGLAASLVGVVGFLAPALREADARLPDHDAAAGAEAPAAPVAATLE